MQTRKIALNCQTRKLFIVIRKNRKYPLALVKEYCEENFDRYAFIEHEKDINPITALVEGCHYHIVAHVRDKGVAKSTHLNRIVDKFKMDNDEGVEIEQMTNEILSIQYLIHKNNKEKTPHNVNEIITNIDKDEFSLIVNSDCGDIISFDYVYSLCCSKKRISEIIKELGLNVYQRYRSVILDIWSDVINENKRKVNNE